MPLREAAAATRGRGMLRDEDWMAAPRRLLAVVARLRGRQAITDERASVFDNGLGTFRIEISAFDWPETKLAPKGRGAECRKNGIEISHFRTACG